MDRRLLFPARPPPASEPVTGGGPPVTGYLETGHQTRGLPIGAQETATAGARWAGTRDPEELASVRTTCSRPTNRNTKEMITTAFVPVAKPAPSPRAPMTIAAPAQRGAPAFTAAIPSRAMPMSPTRDRGSSAEMAPE